MVSQKAQIIIQFASFKYRLTLAVAEVMASVPSMCMDDVNFQHPSLDRH